MWFKKIFILASIVFLTETCVWAQSSKVYFFAYHNGLILNPGTNLSDLVEKAKANQLTAQNSGILDIPLEVSKAELRPLVNDDLYIFSNSKFIGLTKVTKLYLWDDGVAGWNLVYKVDNELMPKEIIKSKIFSESIDVCSENSVDMKKLAVLNSDNEELILKNKLSEKEIKILEREILEVIDVKNKISPPARYVKGENGIKNFREKVAEGLWRPDYLLPGWENNSSIQFSLKLPGRSVKIGIFKYPTSNGSYSFIACQTKKSIFFYPFDQDGTGSHFDQIINWFGTYYVSFFNNGVGGYSKSIYEVTEDGFKYRGGGSVSFD